MVIVASSKVVVHTIPYGENSGKCATPSLDFPSSNCIIWKSIVIPSDMNPPIYVYYKLENFYQNHRKYVKSRCDLQLAGEKVGLTELADAIPHRYYGDRANLGAPANNSLIYAPAGLIAWSMFNDSFQIFHTGNTSLRCDATAPIPVPTECSLVCNATLAVDSNDQDSLQCRKTGVAWPSDKSKKFRAPWSSPDVPQYMQSLVGKPAFYQGEEPTAGRQGHMLPMQTDEDFMVWMRTASLPTFRKLYRRFDNYSFPKDTVLWIRIVDRFRVDSFEGKKFIVISTGSWIGGQNYFLGGAYVAVGGLCFLLAVGFLAKHLVGSRKVTFFLLSDTVVENQIKATK